MHRFPPCAVYAASRVSTARLQMLSTNVFDLLLRNFDLDYFGFDPAREQHERRQLRR